MRHALVNNKWCALFRNILNQCLGPKLVSITFFGRMVVRVECDTGSPPTFRD